MRFLSWIFVLIYIKTINANSDPIEELVRGVVYTTKDVVQKVTNI